jgi:hypothetical protein
MLIVRLERARVAAAQDRNVDIVLRSDASG